MLILKFQVTATSIHQSFHSTHWSHKAVAEPVGSALSMMDEPVGSALSTMDEPVGSTLSMMDIANFNAFQHHLVVEQSSSSCLKWYMIASLSSGNCVGFHAHPMITM